MEKRKLIKIVLVVFFVLNVGTTFAQSTNIEKDISTSIALTEIMERQQLGIDQFNNLDVGRIIKMKDEYNRFSKDFIELRKEGEIGGYMVIDTITERVVEYALGDVHPTTNVKNELYYLGPLLYVEKLNENKFLELKNDQILSSTEFNMLKEKIRSTQKVNNKKSQEVEVASVISYNKETISGVPDYHQSDNTNMLEDCVPTAGANIVMYWDSNGYPNMSTSNDWINVANRLGELMDHSNSNGVNSSKVSPGLDAYFNEKNYSQFNSTRYTSVNFSNIKTEVNNNRPALLRVTDYGYTTPPYGHVVTIVGFEEYQRTSTYPTWYRYMLTHDNWDSTPKEVYLLVGSYGSMTDWWKIDN